MSLDEHPSKLQVLLDHPNDVIIRDFQIEIFPLLITIAA